MPRPSTAALPSQKVSPARKQDFGDVDRSQSPGGVNPVAHRAAREDTGADIVPDRIRSEGGERIDAVGNFAAADRANREQVIEGQGEISRRDEQRRQRDLARLGALDGFDDLQGVDAVQHVVQHVASDADDRDADRDTNSVQNLLVAQKRDRPAYCFQHLHLELRSQDDGCRANSAAASATPAPWPRRSAF